MKLKYHRCLVACSNVQFFNTREARKNLFKKTDGNKELQCLTLKKIAIAWKFLKPKHVRIARLFYDVTYPKGISCLVTTNPTENPARAATIKPVWQPLLGLANVTNMYRAIHVWFNTSEILVTRTNCRKLYEVITMKYVRAAQISTGKTHSAVRLVNVWITCSYEYPTISAEPCRHV